jgi:hypothetical protein
MASALAPIKVEAETDQLVSHAAHFLGRSKKDVVDVAVREYIDNHRDELNAAVQSALRQFDGSLAGTVALVTGYSKAQLDELGGVPSDS